MENTGKFVVEPFYDYDCVHDNEIGIYEDYFEFLCSSTFNFISKVISKVCIDDNVLNVFATRNLLCRNCKQ